MLYPSMWPSRLVACGLMLLTTVGPLRADDAADPTVLEKQFEKHKSAGHYPQAEAVAQQGLAIAERGSKTEPIITWLDHLASVYGDQRRYADAEPLYKRSLAAKEKTLGANHLDVATGLNNLATLYCFQGRYVDAEPLCNRSLTIREKALGADHPDVATSLNNLASLYRLQGRNVDAEPLYKRSLSIREKALGADHPDVAQSLGNLASFYSAQGRYVDAEPLYKRSLNIKEKVLGANHPDVAADLNKLATLYWYQHRYVDAEPLYKRSLAMGEKDLGANHPAVAATLNNLANLYNVQGRYVDAEPLFKRSLSVSERALGANHANVAQSLNNLASLYVLQRRYADAELLYKRSLTIREKALSADHPDVATSLNNLASVYGLQGRYADAELLYKRSLTIREKTLGADHPNVAKSLSNLAEIYSLQGRYVDAEPLFERSLTIRERALGADHSDVVASLNNLASFYRAQGRDVDAEPLYKRSLNIREKVLGADHPDVAQSLGNLASVYRVQGRDVDAEPLYRRSLTIQEKALGADHPNVTESLTNLAEFYYLQGRYVDAEPLVDRAIEILQHAKVMPIQQFKCYQLRGELAWHRDRKQDAIADLQRAIDIADVQRGHASGADTERAEAVAQFGNAYEEMIEWQRQLGNVAEAFATAERSRARTLVDQMAASHLDLLAGLPERETGSLRPRERSAQSRLASLEKQLELLRVSVGPVADQRKGQLKQLEAAVGAASQKVVDAYIAIRNASPAYRQTVSRNFLPASLEQVQVRLAADDHLVLEYVLGSKAGYLIVMPPGGRPARIETLSISPEQAAVLKVAAGPLTAGVLKEALMNAQGSGVLQLLRSEEKAAQAAEKLAALWSVLIPAGEQSSITGGKLKRLIVIPDGALALLPFETLVSELSDHPQYLLDAGIPLVYAPSATLLYNLTEQSSASQSVERRSVLSVGDPNYGGVTAPYEAKSEGSAPQQLQLTDRARYGALRERLQRLPHSGLESTRVVDAFRKEGIAAQQLQKNEATEAKVRAKIDEQLVVHLACYGLSDSSFGNLTGVLAFTPGPPSADAAMDDGFLTLAEIYELNLKGCELAVLSACETNYGPQQRGEGVWALSRGFLVAGSRRVVASNWLVDDEAAARLVSVFCSGVARAAKKKRTVDYAQVLHIAKKWVRNQDKWQSPYYWGAFVLVGAN